MRYNRRDFCLLDSDLVLRFPEIHTEIHPDTHTVSIAGEPHRVRPKTFQLLLTLIKANGEVVSKETLLKEVWDDVFVDEQVVFQSIKELRKLFNGITVIKTVPRKGYAWLPKLSSPEKPDTSKNSDTKPVKYGALILSTLLTVILLAAVVILKPANQPSPVLGSVVVLPVQSELPSNHYDWVRYGLMDQVISRLQSTKQAGVLQTDYVLDVMARAKVSMEDAHEKLIEPIFQVSGAELILAMQVTGNPNDYQILYTLYRKSAIEKGVVLDDSLQDAADQVAKMVGIRMDPDFVLSQKQHVSSFADHAIAEALETKIKGDPKGALALFEAALVTTPGNLIAARLMVQTMVETGATVHEVEKIAMPAIGLAEQTNSVTDKIRLSFWLGVSQSLNGNEAAGSKHLNNAQKLASSVNDWLYLAYIEEIRGRLKLQSKNFSNANDHFQQAMHYHKILHCPLGQSNTLMHLSKLAYAQQDQELAMHWAIQALQLVESRHLDTKLAQTQNWIEHLSREANSQPGT